MGSINYARSIKLNHGTETPGRAVFVSVGTNRINSGDRVTSSYHSIRIGIAVTIGYKAGHETGRTEYRFRTAKEWWRWLYMQCHRRQVTWIVCHDLCQTMTLLDMWAELESGRLSTKYMIDDVRSEDGDERNGLRLYRGTVCLENHPQFILCRSSKGGIRAIDIRNYLDVCPTRLARMVTNAQDTEDTYRDISKRGWAECEAITAGMVTVMSGLWLEWRREDLGVFGLTAPKLSMSSFRHRFMTHTITPCISQDVKDLERESYYGGRVECYYRGRVWSRAGIGDPVSEWNRVGPDSFPVGPVTHLDIRSLYPAVMANNLFPVRLIKRIINPSISEATRYADHFVCVASVAVDSNEREYPVRHNGDTRYATGRFTTALAGCETSRCLGHGDCASVADLMVYQAQPIFRQWIEYWWGERLKAEDKGDTVRALFCKLLLNAMSGKWAQRTPQWIDRPDLLAPPGQLAWSVYDGTTAVAESFRSVFGHVQQRSAPSDPPGSFPAVAACITAYGRQHVRELLSLAPDRSVLYSDTDSFICTSDAVAAFRAEGSIDHRTIGKLRVIWIEPTGIIKGIRHYEFGTNKVCAGLPSNARGVMDTSYECEYIEPPASVISRKPDGRIAVETRIVNYAGLCPGRHYGPDGWYRGIRLPEVWSPKQVTV